MSTQSVNSIAARHSAWVKITHWLGTISFILLLITGIEIIMVHPRFYWGNVGNDLTPHYSNFPSAAITSMVVGKILTPFFNSASSPLAPAEHMTFSIKMGWGRSLHFLSAWMLVFTGNYLPAYYTLYKNIYDAIFYLEKMNCAISNSIRM
jgi:Ni,Fe-hydrogenase I cytochrome b subunit